jgi:hypothetical protein
MTMATHAASRRARTSFAGAPRTRASRARSPRSPSEVPTSARSTRAARPCVCSATSPRPSERQFRLRPRRCRSRAVLGRCTRHTATRTLRRHRREPSNVVRPQEGRASRVLRGKLEDGRIRALTQHWTE